MSRRRAARRWPGPDFLRADWLLLILVMALYLAVFGTAIYQLVTALIAIGLDEFLAALVQVFAVNFGAVR